MEKCSRCGQEIIPGAKFCSECGAPVRSTVEAYQRQGFYDNDGDYVFNEEPQEPYAQTQQSQGFYNQNGQYQEFDRAEYERQYNPYDRGQGQYGSGTYGPGQGQYNQNAYGPGQGQYNQNAYGPGQGQYNQNAYGPGQGQYPHPYDQVGQVGEKNRLAAGLLAILLGALGVHKFYLGYTSTGLIMLLVTIFTFGIGGIVMGIISIVEGVIYLTKSDYDFYETYEVLKKKWF